jgi:tetratricopeptide (TPR) repeat protein
VTQEFYISITPVRDGEYLVRTERVAMGVPLAEELVPWDVDRWLSQTAQVMHDPLVGLLRGNRSGTTATATETETYDLTSLGRELYDAIFQGTIRDSWMIAQGVAQNQNEILRLRLGLKDDRLPLLPWEVLNDGARPLATNTDIVFSRYRSTISRSPNSSEWQRDEANPQPLQILMVLAAPTDQEVLQLHQEAAQLQQELQRETPGNDGGPHLELTILDQPGREQLTQALERSHYDILHYAGHSNLSAAGGDLYLVSNKTGLTEVLSGDDLAGLLVNNGVRMVVFNSCQGFYSASASENGTRSGSLADALLKRNVPAVLAMAEQIPDDVALNLSRLFYRNLKQRSPIDLSLSRARQGLLSSYGSDQLYWALPILYMHAEFDGYLQGTPAVALDPLDVDWASSPGDWEPEDLPQPQWPVPDAAQDQRTINQLIGELQNGQAVPPAIDLDLPDPRGADAIDFHRLGQRLAAQGDVVGALEAYGNAIQLDPAFADAYCDLGLAFEQDGSPNEALTAYKMALHYDPQSAAAAHLKRLTTTILRATDADGTPDTPTPLLNQINPDRPATNAASDRIFATGTTTAKTVPQTTHQGSLANGKTIAMTAATLAVLGSIWFLAGRPQGPATNAPAPSASNAANQELVATSTASFSQQDLRKGTEAVAQLLDNGALVEAENALNAVPSKHMGTPVVAYLRGRLAWESIKRQPTSFSFTDARRYWSTAVKEQPNDLHYRNTLGFGFYAERNWEEAAKTWKQASQLNGEESEKLTAEAGQALVLMKQSQQGAKPDSAKLQSAKQLRDRVIKANPTAFQPNNLAKDWRWTEPMIADWANLLAAK